MPVLTGHFDLLRKRIEPSADRAKKAQDMPRQIRQYLENHTEFETEDPHTRLGGSYARSTAIKDIKDVDIIVFAAESWRDQTIPQLMDALHAALKGLPQALNDCGAVTIRRQRRSVNVFLEDHDLSLDIVPVLKTGSILDDQLEVPDREWDDWIYSHPFGYGCSLAALNGDNGGKVVPMVKMWKHWRDMKFPVKNKPKSYWLESLVFQHIRRGWVTTEGKGDGALFADLCDSIYDRFASVSEREEETPFIPDGKLRNHVAWNWKRSAFDTFLNRLEETHRWARRAVETDDADEAVELWQRVFGDEWFPSKADLSAEYQKVGALSQAGGLFVTSAGEVLTERPATGKCVSSPAKRFFGEDKR